MEHITFGQTQSVQPATTTQAPDTATSLKDSVRQAVSSYLSNMGSEIQGDLYNLLLEEVEEPLIKLVLDYTRHNQVRTAKILGISRGTLRKKMKKYGFL